MIPARLDIEAILADLAEWGWRDFKIETMCGFASGYIAQLKCGAIREPSFSKGARLYNFWADERDRVSRGTLYSQVTVVTTQGV